jgi:hypothetical protein
LEEHEQYLSAITITGVVISVLSLFGMIWLFRRYLSHELSTVATKILFHLCVTLVLSQISFIAAIDRKVHLSDISCSGMAYWLHYIMLVSWAWTVSEAIHLRERFVIVIAPSMNVKWFAMGSYIVPLFVVGTSAGLFHEDYGTEDVCWIRPGSSAIWFFVGPALLSLVVNAYIFVGVIRTIHKEVESKMMALKAAATFVVTLGLTNAFGAMIVLYGDVVWHYLFGASLALQGLAIFYFHCWRRIEGMRAKRKTKNKITIGSALADKKQQRKHRRKHRTPGATGSSDVSSNATSNSTSTTTSNATAVASHSTSERDRCRKERAAALTNPSKSNGLNNPLSVSTVSGAQESSLAHSPIYSTAASRNGGYASPEYAFALKDNGGPVYSTASELFECEDNVNNINGGKLSPTTSIGSAGSKATVFTQPGNDDSYRPDSRQPRQTLWPESAFGNASYLETALDAAPDSASYIDINTSIQSTAYIELGDGDADYDNLVVGLDSSMILNSPKALFSPEWDDSFMSPAMQRPIQRRRPSMLQTPLGGVSRITHTTPGNGGERGEQANAESSPLVAASAFLHGHRRRSPSSRGVSPEYCTPPLYSPKPGSKTTLL